MRGAEWAGIRSLIFVRHAMPLVVPSRPAREWLLSADGVRAAQRLRLPVAPGARVLASSETRAIRTTAIATGLADEDVLVDADFDEVRGEEPVDEGFRDRRRAWIRGERDARHDGWEASAAVAARMDAAILRHRAPSMIIGTHGMTLTAWLVHAGLIGRGDPAVAFWESLPFPARVEVAHDPGAGLTLVSQ